MARRTSPPFRADHVGSLLRPQRLLQARDDFAAGRITAAELRSVEDQEIPRAVRMQEEVGLQSATDGEFRRASWHMDFIYALGGVSKTPGNMAVKFRNAAGEIEFTPASIRVDGKIRIDDTIFADAFTFLQVPRHHGGAQADDPVAEHGPLPRRPRLRRPGRLPRHGGVLGGPGRGVRR